MRKYILGFVLVLSTVISSCRFIEERDFEISYDGFLSGNFTGHADLIPCDQFNDGLIQTTLGMQELSDRPGRSYVILYFPVAVKAGKYLFSNSDFSRNNFKISATIFDTKKDNYFYFPSESLISGFIELDTISTAASQRTKGRFEGQFQSDSINLNLQGEFDFIPSGDFPDDCLRDSKTPSTE